MNNKINFVRFGKDELNVFDHPSAVYKINCKECPISYIGQAGRSVSRRMIEHEGAVSKSDERSVVAMHSKISGHCFDFEKSKILDTKNSVFKRELLKMLHIDSTHPTINRNTDIRRLKTTYKKSISILLK